MSNKLQEKIIVINRTVSLFLKVAITFFLLFSFSIKATVILQYHHISNDSPKSTSTSPEQFAQHMDYLDDNNFNVISIESLMSKLEQKQPLPEKSIVITFDDGYDSIFDNAFPILKSKKFPFTVFVNTQPLKGNLSQFMTWQQLDDLTKYGGTIANHSVTHLHMIRQLKNETFLEWRKRVSDEVLNSQIELESKINNTVRAFAYPYGEYNSELKSLLEELEFYGFGQQSGAVAKSVDRQAIPRFPFGGVYGKMDDFKLKVNSRALPIERIELYSEDNQLLKDHILTTAIKRPKLKLVLRDKKLAVSCFFSPQGRMESVREERELVVYPNVDLTPGRSRYNCTAPTGDKNKYYWFSQPWIKPNDDGSWYAE